MKNHLAVMFAVSVWATLASAQTNIVVGSGSYASSPPPQTGDIAISTQAVYVVASTNSPPIPTNKWWTDLIIHQYAGNMWAYPLTVSADANGINIYDPVTWVPSGLTPQLALDSPLSIHGQGFAPADARALRWGDWTVSFRMQQATNQFMDATIGHGLPYVWVEFTGVQPQITFSGATSFFGDSGNSLSLPLTTNHFGITYSGHSYGIFAPDNTQFTLSNGVINVTFAGTNTYLVVGILPAQTNLSYFSQYAYAVPRDSQMNWGYDPAAGIVTTSWHLATQVLKGTEPRVIQGWLAHHWRNTTNNLALNGVNYSTARGPMKCALGTDFQILYQFNGIPPTLPPPEPTGRPNDYDPSRMNAYITSVAADTNIAIDTYWGGKDMFRYAQHMAMAHDMGRPEFTTLQNTVRSALEDWYTYTPNEASYYFAAYPGWKALIGYQSSYGTDQFNDQHFHYGYFTHAAALVGLYDQTFLQNYGPMARLVAKEYANWDRTDPNFPLFRTFDIWSGHSQASGFPDSGRGGNQESSSEAVNSWGGLFLLGAMLQDDPMRAAGAMGYIMESTAVREYWFNENGDVWPPGYLRSCVGILWDNGQDFQTYFGGNPDYVHGIQMLPLSPTMMYLAHNPAFAQQTYNSLLSEQLQAEGDNSISSMGSQWGNYALWYALQFNPDYVAAQMDQLYATNDAVATDPMYAGATYYFTHAYRTLGALQWQYHISVPTSAVYYNTNNAQLSYVAYNPSTNTQVATVYSNNIAVDTITLPPLTLVTQTSQGTNQFTNGVTIVTNVVAADVEPGVFISWPTMVSSNYQPLWATVLSTNTPWSNLVSQITGDGTTNSVFDAFGSYQQKFYQVLQIGESASGGTGPMGNVLSNGGFETAGATTSNAANWTVDQASGGPVSGVRTNDNPHSGSFTFEVHLASTGGGPLVEFSQAGVPVTGGVSYAFSFYADRLTGSAGDNDEYNIEWFNSNSVLVAQTGYTTFAPGANVYAQTAVNGLTAPPTAASATIFFHCAGAATPSLSATLDFDDVSLTNSAGGGGGGGGGTVVVTNQVQAGIARGVSITWFASNAVPYQVQWSADQSTWNNLGGLITGTGSSNTVFDVVGQPEHYYQVLSIQ